MIKIILSFLIIVFSLCAEAENDPVATFLSAQEGGEDHLGATLKGNIKADLNKDAKIEYVIVWVTLGPSFWYFNLTILDEHGKLISTKKLVGEAELVNVVNGVININLITAQANDPICCPSLQKKASYSLKNGEIQEINENAPL